MHPMSLFEAPRGIFLMLWEGGGGMDREILE